MSLLNRKATAKQALNGYKIDMELFRAIRSRRSHRAFLERPVEREKVMAILEAGIWAPSPDNCQPWEFTVVTSEPEREQLRHLAEEALAADHMEVRGFSYIRPLPETAGGIDKPVKRYSLGFLRQVPVFIAVSGITDAVAAHDTREETSDSYKYACAAAIQNMLLAAEALKLGSLWFTVFQQSLLKKCLGIEANRHLLALICLGYPARTPTTSEREPLEDKVRWID